MKIRHIFFDLDNTLWDHRKNAVLTLNDLFEKQQINAKFDIVFEDFHHRYNEVNEDLWIKIRDGIIDKDFLRKRRFYDTFSHFGINDEELSDYFEKHFLDEIINYNELVPGAIEILDYLSAKGYQLHIISNGFHEVTFRKVQNSGIEKYFGAIVNADDARAMKPDARIFEYALLQANAELSETMLIGDDWTADIQGGKSFGLDVIFFDSLKEGRSEEGLKVVTDLLDIKKYL